MKGDMKTRVGWPRSRSSIKPGGWVLSWGTKMRDAIISGYTSAVGFQTGLTSQVWMQFLV